MYAGVHNIIWNSLLTFILPQICRSLASFTRQNVRARKTERGQLVLGTEFAQA